MGTRRPLGRCRGSQARTHRVDRACQSEDSPQLLNPRKATCGDVFATMAMPKEGRTMATRDRIYCARRAAEEQELAEAASDPQAADTHRRLQRAYLERASI